MAAGLKNFRANSKPVYSVPDNPKTRTSMVEGEGAASLGCHGIMACTVINIMEQVALIKSSLLLKIQKQKTQTLQLFTKIIKTEIIYKSY
jgi:hypothetical protein